MFVPKSQLLKKNEKRVGLASSLTVKVTFAIEDDLTESAKGKLLLAGIKFWE